MIKTLSDSNQNVTYMYINTCWGKQYIIHDCPNNASLLSLLNHGKIHRSLEILVFITLHRQVMDQDKRATPEVLHNPSLPHEH